MTKVADIRFVTPDARHAGRDRATRATRASLYEDARRKIRNAGQAKPATGTPPDLSGSTPKTKPAPLKSETPHEISGQLV